MLSSSQKIGQLIVDLRTKRGMTQSQLANELGTSQSAVNRIERGAQNISLDLINRISDVFNFDLIQINQSDAMSLSVIGGNNLSGTALVPPDPYLEEILFTSALLNTGKTTINGLHRTARINKIVNLLDGLDIRCKWTAEGIEISPHDAINIDQLSAIGLKRYRKSSSIYINDGSIILINNSDPQLNISALLGSMCDREQITIHNLNYNYCTQEACLLLQQMGLKIQRNNDFSLTITRPNKIKTALNYTIPSSPLSALQLITASVITNSSITLINAPTQYLSTELALFSKIGVNWTLDSNGQFNINTSNKYMPLDNFEIKAANFPAIDNSYLPYFALILTYLHQSATIKFHGSPAPSPEILQSFGAGIAQSNNSDWKVLSDTIWRSANTINLSSETDGALTILAALIHSGKTILLDPMNCLHQYSPLITTLKNLGAQIETHREI